MSQHSCTFTSSFFGLDAWTNVGGETQVEEIKFVLFYNIK